MKKQVRVIISGRVQGVFFRDSTEKMARSLGLTGWVKNRPDRRVEAVFAGEEGALAQMLDWCRQGPTLARVTDAEVMEEPVSGNLTEFRILY